MKIVIFDMDGTLLNSAKDITISVNTVREINYGLLPLEESFVVDVINREHRNLSELFYGTLAYEKKDQDLFEEHYDEQCIKNVYLYEGIEESLKALLSKQVRLSVATNAPTKFARRMLEQCGVIEHFDFIVGADKVKKAKPDKEMLENILNGYGYRREHKALMIGDNMKDMKAASHAGIDSAFATWGFSPVSPHPIALSSPREIIDLLHNLK